MKKKITIALDENILARIDWEVEADKAKNRSAAIESHLVKYYGDFTDASAIIFAHDYKWDIETILLVCQNLCWVCEKCQFS